MNSPARILFNYAIKRKSVYRVENTLGDKAEFFSRISRTPSDADAITGEL